MDKTVSRKEDMHIATYDLSCDDQVDSLLRLMEKEVDNLLYTLSLQHAELHHGHENAPGMTLCDRDLKRLKRLRSQDEPEGASGLSGTDKIRRELAIIVYDNTARIIRHADKRKVACSLENPGNSLFWAVPCIATLIQDIGGNHTLFHKCCHGGLRKKLSMRWRNVDRFVPLAATCQDDHHHKPWKPQKHEGPLHYPTSEEAAYPILLCEWKAGIVLEQAILQGATVAVDLHQQQQTTDQSTHRFLLNMLPVASAEPIQTFSFCLSTLQQLRTSS